MVKGMILTPPRMVLIHDFVIKPLKFLWGMCLCILMGDLVLVYFRVTSLLYFIPFLDRLSAGYIVVGLPALYALELWLRFQLLTFLFGKTLKIYFYPEKLVIQNGFRKKAYKRQHDVGFAGCPFPAAEHPIYMDSQSFEIVIADLQTKRITEFYDIQKVSQFAANSNFANAFSQGEQELDIDPRSQ